MIYVLTFLIALTGMLGISKGNLVQAAEEESTQKGSISIVCPVEGMELSLYRVAEYEESGSFTLTEQFQKYPVSLEQKSQEGWQGTADALAAEHGAAELVVVAQQGLVDLGAVGVGDHRVFLLAVAGAVVGVVADVFACDVTNPRPGIFQRDRNEVPCHEFGEIGLIRLGDD